MSEIPSPSDQTSECGCSSEPPRGPITPVCAKCGGTGFVQVEIVTANSILSNPAVWKDGIVPERFR